MKQSPPPGHYFVETEDGSLTLFSETYQEACHSTSGAKKETILHYINGCEIPSKALLHHPLYILEVGFGLGVGFLTTLEYLPPQSFVEFISLEKDRHLLDWFKENHPELNLCWSENILSARAPNFELKILCGDARVELPKYLSTHPTLFHAIYQDAFSPKKNPTLWTKEWFELLNSSSHACAILSTYSASSSVRKALHEAQWGIENGHQFGKKRSSTRAHKNKKTHPELLLQLDHSPVSAFYDRDYLS